MLTWFFWVSSPFSFGEVSSCRGAEMERQRSFSFKPTGLLLFSFAVSSSLMFCLLVSLWALSNNSSSARETHLLFSSGHKAPGIPSRTASSDQRSSSDGEAKGNKEPEETHFVAVDGSSAGGRGFVLKQLSTVSGDAHRGDGGSGSSAGDPQRVWKAEDGILAENHLEVAINSSENSPDSEGKKGDIILSESYHTVSGDSSQEGLVLATEKDGDEEGQEFSNASEVGGDSSEVGISMNIDSGNISTSDAVNNVISFVKKIEGEGGAACDVSSGRWVLDVSYPLYTNNSCPFIDEGFNCQTNGRLDKDYMKWRWQPHGCNIPRFDAVKMLELIRGKRLVFVGDSINRNQWESMLCLLRGASDPRRVYEAHGRRITKERGNYNFKFLDYRCSVEYYVTHFLVREGKAWIGAKRKPTLKIDIIDRGSSKWRGADILIFNTAHWWSHYKTKAGVNYFQEGEQVHPQLEVMTAFRRALMTWSSWVDKHVTPGKTKVFFRTSSPSHFRGGQWNSGGHCKESTQPLSETVSRSSPEMNIIVEEVIKQMSTPVTLLNITMLSGLRIDAHPSLYGKNPGSGAPGNTQDCSHWCLPGVPDTWNELLYYYLLSEQNTASVH